jgi:uncharacterized protein
LNSQAVINSTCLIVLDRIGRLDILQSSFSNVSAPVAVQNEVGISIGWINFITVKNATLVNALRTQVHDGEAEAIALALEIADSILILDDKKARAIAKRMGLKVIGTIGMIIKAKQQGIISEVTPILISLQQTGFHI